MPAATPPEPQQFQRWMAFDFGHRRTGVAVGSTIARSCQPLTTVSAARTERIAAIRPLIEEWQPQALVVGLPLHPDGAPHDMTRSAQKFMRQLAHHFALPVYSMDERYTSAEAENARAEDVDATAAMLILERFFLTALPVQSSQAAAPALHPTSR